MLVTPESNSCLTERVGCISEASYTELWYHHPNGIYHFAPFETLHNLTLSVSSFNDAHLILLRVI